MSVVRKSVLHSTLFWAHLCCGVAAGLFILSMSVTGVLLTYEHQMVESAERRNHVAAEPGQVRLAADALAGRAKELAAGNQRLSLVFVADPTAPVAVSA